jgi:CO dehydrogenase/acetyl-CoA synthase alpha subunit
VNVTERNLLIAHGQSKKLADIRKKFQPDLPVEAVQRNSVPKKQLLTGLKPEVAEELNKAISLIDDNINRIMRSFPEGKKNRLFSFRFGSVDAVKNMSIKAAFKTLAIDDNSVKMKLIAELNYHGDEVKGR